MAHAKARILLNAEAFGFGPSAAIAAIAPLLQKARFSISYIGEAHTLDLQRQIPYQNIFDVTNLSPAKRQQLLQTLAAEYDLFFTAMDFNMAQLAKQAGMKVGIYDALTWYWRKESTDTDHELTLGWPDIRPIVQSADLYAVQKFYGVEKKIRATSGLLPHTTFVAPIVQKVTARGMRDTVLLNLGGLQNPAWNFEDTVLYARLIIDTVKRVLAPDESLTVATSSAVAEAVDEPDCRSHTRAEMIKVLAKTKYALMTPGLGNIYDSANYGIPTVWLPPANDSQGQQVTILEQHGCLDARVDWKDFSHPIDYMQPQQKVLGDISRNLREAGDSTSILETFHSTIKAKLEVVAPLLKSKTSKLLDTFGHDGQVEISHAITELLRGISS